jgi:lycopene cyclase domain-containing protein
MNPHYTYLMVDLCCIAGPFLLSFYPAFSFHKRWRSFLLPCLLTACFFLIWDAVFTYLGVWGFSKEYVLGIYLLGMPIEEYLFFICIPFACVFTFHVFNILFDFNRSSNLVKWGYIAGAIILFLVGITHLSTLYTSVTFILLSLLLAFLIVSAPTILPSFFFCFLFILIPFLISNGILTGSFLHRVVVWYNDEENLGVRLLTIPVEDIFYAHLLLLINVYGYDRMNKKKMIQSR